MMVLCLCTGEVPGLRRDPGGGGWVAVGGQAFTTCFHLQIKMGAPAEVGRLTSN